MIRTGKAARCLGHSPVGVRLDFVDLRQGADEESHAVGNPARRDQPQVPLAQFGVGRHRKETLTAFGLTTWTMLAVTPGPVIRTPLAF